MRNPNGYGTVAKLSGNRRRPYIVKKVKGWRPNKLPIYDIVGYAASRSEGLMLLAKYNNDPWDVDSVKITFKELWELFQEKKLPHMGKSLIKSLKSAYKHCVGLDDKRYKDLRAYHVQDIISNCGLGPSVQKKIKNLFYHLDRFALELDIVDRTYSQLLTTDPSPETSRVPFTDDEIKLLWENVTVPWVDSVLFLLYSGFRVAEMMGLKTNNIDLERGIMKGGIKTAAGKNRIVPIHSKILNIVRSRMGEEYLFCSDDGEQLNHNKYYFIWKALMSKLKMAHTPHDCRHTLRSRLDSAGANKVCIDLILGHKSNEVGERVYTHKTIKELKEAIELVTN